MKNIKKISRPEAILRRIKNKHLDALSDVIESAQWASRHGDEYIEKDKIYLTEDLYGILIKKFHSKR